MSMSRQMQESVTQFCAITGASTKDAKRMIEKYKRVDVAIDAYYSGGLAASSPSPRTAGPSTSKITELFEKYKDREPADPTADLITIDGTLQFCSDLDLNPEDVLVLSIAYELKSPRMGEWTRKGWVEGWKALNVDSISGFKDILPGLRNKLSSDPDYYTKVYQHTFDFGRSEGQRSIAVDTAKAFWEILIPIGLEGGALSHIVDDDEDDSMNGSHGGWTDEHTQWWFDFLTEKGGKGVSKDTWSMFRDFVRTINADFSNYDPDGAWPSSIDDFVEWGKAKVGKS